MKVVSGMALALWPSDASDVCSMPRRNLCSSCLFSGLFSKALFQCFSHVHASCQKHHFFVVGAPTCSAGTDYYIKLCATQPKASISSIKHSVEHTSGSCMRTLFLFGVMSVWKWCQCLSTVTTAAGTAFTHVFWWRSVSFLLLVFFPIFSWISATAT